MMSIKMTYAQQKCAQKYIVALAHKLIGEELKMCIASHILYLPYCPIAKLIVSYRLRTPVALIWLGDDMPQLVWPLFIAYNIPIVQQYHQHADLFC